MKPSLRKVMVGLTQLVDAMCRALCCIVLVFFLGALLIQWPIGLALLVETIVVGVLFFLFDRGGDHD